MANSSIIAAFSIALFVFFALFFPYSFNYEIQLSHYWLLYFLAIVVLFLTGLVISRWRVIGWVELFLLVTGCVCLTFFLFSTYYSIANEHFTVYLIVYLTGLALWMTVSTGGIYAILFIFLLNYIFQLGVGIYQFAALATGNPHGWLAITGTLGNSGIYCCFLVCGLPFVHHVLFHPAQGTMVYKMMRGAKRISREILFCSLLLIAGMIVCYCFSRTALLGGIVLLAARRQWAGRRGDAMPEAAAPGAAIRTKRPYILLGLLAVAGLALAVAFKWNSSVGRVLSWTVTGKHVGEYWWFGTGLGRFTWYYPQWQAAYFQNGKAIPAGFITSAGETYIAFNEYLQLLVETGILGCVTFAVIVYTFFKTRGGGELARAAKLTVAAILVMACTSYLFHSTVVLFFFLLCLVIVYKAAPLTVTKPHALPRRFLRLPVVCVFTCIAGYTIFFAGKKAQKAIALIRGLDNGAPGVTELLRADYPEFRHDGKFLAIYAEHRDSASELYEDALHYFISKQLVACCAQAERQAGRYDQAKHYYTWLSDYLPGAFTPRFELMKLYQYLGDRPDMLRLARQIDSMPVKISSYETNDIKMQTKMILRDIRQ